MKAEVVKETKDVVNSTIVFEPYTLATRIVEFAEASARICLYSYQKEFAYRLAYSLLVNDGEEITALFSRQSGKTETIAVITPALLIILPVLANIFSELEAFRGGLWVGIFAPIYEQASTTYERMRLRIKTETAQEILMDPDIQTQIVGNGIRLDNGSYVRMMSASKNAQIESKTYHLAILEECQDIDEKKILKSIHPMLAATNGTIIKIGTPNGEKCEFLSAIQRNRRKDANCANRSLRNHFQYDYMVCQKSNSRYKKFIDREIERFGVDGDYFRMAYALHWMIEKGVYVTEHQLDNLMHSELDFVEEDVLSVHVLD